MAIPDHGYSVVATRADPLAERSDGAGVAAKRPDLQISHLDIPGHRVYCRSGITRVQRCSSVDVLSRETAWTRLVIVQHLTNR